MNRQELAENLESLGAVVQQAVTKKTDILIVGAERGEIKYNQALKYNVTILPWVMVKAIGLLEERPVSSMDNETIDLTRDVVFQMIRLVDNLYAHCIERNELFRGFELGSASVESLLQAAWGSELDGDSGGCEDSLEDNRERVGRCLRECISFWGGMINEISNANSSTSDVLS